jgi:hypothetical protein
MEDHSNRKKRNGMMRGGKVFRLSCIECGETTELEDGFLKKDLDFDLRIIGEDTIEFKCHYCANEIVSF